MTTKLNRESVKEKAEGLKEGEKKVRERKN